MAKVTAIPRTSRKNRKPKYPHLTSTRRLGKSTGSSCASHSAAAAAASVRKRLDVASERVNDIGESSSSSSSSSRWRTVKRARVFLYFVKEMGANNYSQSRKSLLDKERRPEEVPGRPAAITSRGTDAAARPTRRWGPPRLSIGPSSIRQLYATCSPFQRPAECHFLGLAARGEEGGRGRAAGRQGGRADEQWQLGSRYFCRR